MTDAPDLPPIADLVDDEPFTDEDLVKALAINEYTEVIRESLADHHDLAEGLVPTVVAQADADGVEPGPNGLLIVPDAHTDGTAPLRWAITGTRSAEWALMKLREARERDQEVHEQALAMAQPYVDQIERIDDWAVDERSAAKDKIRFFEGHLERWALEQRATTGAMSVKLPSGTIGTRETPARFEIADHEDALFFAHTVGADVKETVTVTALKDKVKIVDHLVYVADLPFSKMCEGLIAVGMSPDAVAVLDPQMAIESAWRMGLREPMFKLIDAPIRFDQTHSAYDIECGADPTDGKWVALDTETGQVIGAAEGDPEVRIDIGPHVVGPDGRPVDGLRVIDAEVKATVKIAE